LPSGFAAQFGILRCTVSAQRRPALFDVTQTPSWSDECRAMKGRSPVVVVRKIAKSQSQRVSQLGDDPYQGP
jgi:hypothetical protein